MAKIAVLIADNINNRKGMMNAELNRISHLKSIANYQIDVYAFQTYPGWLIRKLRCLSKVIRFSKVRIDGIDISVKWRRFSLIDYILTVKFHKAPLVNKDWELRYISDLKTYDIIVANSTDLGYMAYMAGKKYSIPYFVTWHGSDIHTAPFESNSVFDKTKIVLDNATANFMVSKALLETSKQISSVAKSIVLYNGVNKNFTRYCDEERLKLRQSFDITQKKIVAFAGHLIEVKNPQLFPEIFNTVHKKIKSSIEFWILGTGKMSNYVQTKCEEYNVPLKMWGNIPVEKMPSMLNCIDVLILPSRNEGLPLIAIEALACGANAVGAKVGGIPEAMGEENTFEHGENFVESISNRIVFMLQNKVEQHLLPVFSWEETAQIENNLYLRYLSNSR